MTANPYERYTRCLENYAKQLQRLAPVNNQWSLGPINMESKLPTRVAITANPRRTLVVFANACTAPSGRLIVVTCPPFDGVPGVLGGFGSEDFALKDQGLPRKYQSTEMTTSCFYRHGWLDDSSTEIATLVF